MAEISVIVPVYNVEKYLRKCVDSILAQSFSDFELWLVDDGSPDGCGAICDECSKMDPRIKVIHKTNGGLSDARNAALDRIQSRYVFFVDADDWLTPDALESLHSAALRTGAKVVTGNMAFVYEDGTIQEDDRAPKEERMLRGNEILTTLLRPNACNKLYDVSLFDNVRYPVGKLYEDVFVYHTILDQIDLMVMTGKVTYYYLKRHDSIMNAEYNIRFTDIVDAVYDRALWLDSIGEKKLSNETKMFVYSQVAVATAHLDKKNPVHRKRLNEITDIYRDCYPALMEDDSISVKQKARFFILNYCPSLHNCLWGRKMPINLGG